MKLFIIACLSVSLCAVLSAEDAPKKECQCKNCKCTQEMNCGCKSGNGCQCTPGAECGNK